MISTRTSFRTVSGLSLAADRSGPSDKPTVLLLHGGGQTRHSWSAATSALVERGYQAIAVDARGHGESDWAQDGNYALPVLAEDVAAIVNQLGRPVAIVGASMGGLSSLYAAGAGLTDLIRALVLVDITLRPAAEGVGRILSFMTAHEDGFADHAEAAEAIAGYNPARRRRGGSRSGLDKVLRRREDGRYYWHWDPRFLRPSPDQADNWATGALKTARNVQIPTLLIRGEHSDIVDNAGITELSALIPHVELREVEGAGHMVAGDRNDAFVDAVTDYLAKVFPPG